MNAQSETITTAQSGQHLWSMGAAAIGIITFSLAAYQFVVIPILEPANTATGSAVRTYWPIFAGYLIATALALGLAPGALRKAQIHGRTTGLFSVACIMVAICGGAMSLVNGKNGIGENVIHFYWNGLAIIWIASIAMVHLSEALKKPLAVRDWTVYSYAMLLLPLTIVPSMPIWPELFDLDAHQTIITATTSSFAAHFLIAHYVIFEHLERSSIRSRR